MGDHARSSDTVVDDVPAQEVPTCTLDCRGHGTCRYGMKDISSLGDAAYGHGMSATHENLQHCVCDDGYTGIYCDHPVRRCEDSEIFCLNGAACALDRSGSPYCDRTIADGDGSQKFYGPSCEFLITSFCRVGSREAVHSELDAFCVNDGLCKEIVKDDEEYVMISMD